MRTFPGGSNPSYPKYYLTEMVTIGAHVPRFGDRDSKSPWVGSIPTAPAKLCTVGAVVAQRVLQACVTGFKSQTVYHAGISPLSDKQSKE